MSKKGMMFFAAGLTAMAMTAVPVESKAQSTEIKAAIKFTDNEQFDKASRAFKAMVAKDATDADTWYYFGENLLAEGKIDSAEVLYKKGWEVNPKNPLNQVGVAKVQRIRGKMAEAQTALDAALALLNDKSARVKDELEGRVYVEAAQAMLEGTPKNTAKAIEYTNKALTLNESNVRAYIVKAEAMFEADPLSATEPLGLYKKAIELDKNSAEAQAGAAYMYYRARLYKNAIEYYTNAINIDPNFAPAYSGRGDAYYYNNQPEEGLKDYQKYLALNNDNVTAQKRYVGFLIAAKKYDQALTEITKLEKNVGTKDPILNRLKGYATYEKGDYKTALESMNFFLNNYQQKDRINATDYEYLGRTYGKSSSDSLMGYYLDKAISIDPKNKLYLADEMINLYKEKKDKKKTIEWRRKKIGYGSKDINDWYYLGIDAYYADDCATCDTAFTEYIKHQPDFAMAHYYLAWAKDCQDTLTPKAWVAKPTYEAFLAKLKPEEIEKQNKKVSEAYFFLARYYYFSDTKDYSLSKCYANKVVSMNASESWVKAATDFMKYKEIAAATPSPECK